jgi:small subunit ribosomal protein S16
VSVRIRLRRMGAKKQPFYRVVVADSRSPRDGRFLDTIGTYNPRAEPAAIDIDREKTMKWLEEGALPTDSARALLSRAGIWQEFKTGASAETIEPAEVRPVAIEEPVVPPEAEAEARSEEPGESTAPE